MRGISAGMAVKLRLVQSTFTSPRSASLHKHGPQWVWPLFQFSHPSVMLTSEIKTAIDFHNTAITQTKLRSSFVALVYLSAWVLAATWYSINVSGFRGRKSKRLKTPIKTIAIFRVEGKDQKQKWSVGDNILYSYVSTLAIPTVNKMNSGRSGRSLKQLVTIRYYILSLLFKQCGCRNNGWYLEII